ncbi:MAG: hypothetical protein ACR2RL_07075 [Gammaproteobacteria bacterium]
MTCSTDSIIRSRRCALLSSVVLALTLLGGAVHVPMAAADTLEAEYHGPSRHMRTLHFEIAENATRFVFDDEPLDEDGLPAYGNEFITEGYLYPRGFLRDRDGVLPNGGAAFPEKVLGRWTCRGWHVGEGAKTKTGPIVITTQYFDLDDTSGHTSLVTEGVELADVGVPVRRAITGGTGRFRNARGQSVQRLLGLDAMGGVKLRVSLRPGRRWGR